MEYCNRRTTRESKHQLKAALNGTCGENGGESRPGEEAPTLKFSLRTMTRASIFLISQLVASASTKVQHPHSLLHRCSVSSLSVVAVMMHYFNKPHAFFQFKEVAAKCKSGGGCVVRLKKLPHTWLLSFNKQFILQHPSTKPPTLCLGRPKNFPLI